MTLQLRLSPGEERLLALLPKDGSRVNVLQLTERFYHGRNPPHHARIAVGGLVRSLVDKTEKNTSWPKVKRGPRLGPRSMEVWLESEKPERMKE